MQGFLSALFAPSVSCFNPTIRSVLSIVNARGPLIPLSSFLGWEVAHILEIGDETGSGGIPSQLFPCMKAGRPHVQTGEEPKPAKVLACLLSGEGEGRQLQAPSDCLGDLSKRQALFADRGISG